MAGQRTEPEMPTADEAASAEIAAEDEGEDKPESVTFSFTGGKDEKPNRMEFFVPFSEEAIVIEGSYTTDDPQMIAVLRSMVEGGHPLKEGK